MSRGFTHPSDPDLISGCHAACSDRGEALSSFRFGVRRLKRGDSDPFSLNRRRNPMRVDDVCREARFLIRPARSPPGLIRNNPLSVCATHRTRGDSKRDVQACPHRRSQGTMSVRSSPREKADGEASAGSEDGFGLAIPGRGENVSNTFWCEKNGEFDQHRPRLSEIAKPH